MSLSQKVYPGDGVTVTFGTPPNISRDHITVLVDGVEQLSGWSWTGENQITFDAAPSASSRIVIRRSSSLSARLVDYTNASTFGEEELNTDSLQAFYLAQEAYDTAERALTVDDATGRWLGAGRRLTGLADGEEDSDAATVGQLRPYADEASDAASSAISARDIALDARDSAVAANLSAQTAAAEAADKVDLRADTIADLEANDQALAQGLAFINGYYDFGDNGAGAVYIADPSDSTTLSGAFDSQGRWTIVTGAGIRRKLASRGSLNVAHVGVRGDGTSADQTRLEAAINAVGDVFIPAGMTCLLTEPLVITRKGARLCGPGSVIKAVNAPCGIHILADDVVIDGIDFRPQTTSGQPNWDIKLGDGIKRPTIRNCTFAIDDTAGKTYTAIGSSDDAGVFIRSDGVNTTTNQMLVSDNRPEYLDGDPFRLLPINPDTDVAPGGLEFDRVYYLIKEDVDGWYFSLADTEADALAGTAIDITDSGTGRWTLQKDGTDWPYAAPVTGLRVLNNLFVGYTHHCYLFSVQDFVITGNYFEGCSHDSIRLREADGWGTISNNIWKNIGDLSVTSFGSSRDCVDSAFSGRSLTIMGNVAHTVSYHMFDLKGASLQEAAPGFQTRNMSIIGNVGEDIRGSALAFGNGSFYSGEPVDGQSLWGLTVLGNQWTNIRTNQASGGVGMGGIDIKEGARYINIDNNALTVVYARGIVVRSGTQNVRLGGNTVLNATDAGIYVFDAEVLEIDGNTVDSIPSLENDGEMFFCFSFLRSSGDGDHLTRFTNNYLGGHTAAPMSATTNHQASFFTEVRGNVERGTQAYGDGTNRARWRQQRPILHGNGTAPASTEGNFQQGSVIFNTGATTGGHAGLIAVSSGSTGGTTQWAPFGIVGAVRGAAVADLGQTISNPPTQAEVQALSDKVDELLGALRTANLIAT